MLYRTVGIVFTARCTLVLTAKRDTIRYDTIGEFNVDWKADYSALSSTRSQKKKLKRGIAVACRLSVRL